MATGNAFGNIEKLNEDNYELWKVQMKSVFIYNDLWHYVDGSIMKPEGDASEWVRKDSKALALINLSITHGQLNHVKKAKTSQEACRGLMNIFESRGPVRKAALYKQLLRMETKKHVSMTQYVTEFTNKADQLEEAGITDEVQDRPIILWDFVSPALKYRPRKKFECFIRPLRFNAVSVRNTCGNVADDDKVNRLKYVILYPRHEEICLTTIHGVPFK